MVQKKTSQNKNWLMDELDRIDKEHPVVATKWAVEEVTPAYEEWGYYGQSVPEKFVKVSEYFDTKEEAEAWMDEHEADEGKFLAIRKHIAREYCQITWVSVRVKN